MNVKYKIIILILLFSLVLVGCLKESYSMQYGFSGELITETKLESKPDGVYLEMPFADFSCDSKSFKRQRSNRISSCHTLMVVLLQMASPYSFFSVHIRHICID